MLYTVLYLAFFLLVDFGSLHMSIGELLHSLLEPHSMPLRALSTLHNQSPVDGI